MNTFTTVRHARGLLAGACLLIAAGAQAAPAGPRSTADIEATYRSERQACIDGRTGQSQATCLKEAAAARQQALNQGLDGGQTPQQLKRNALARCDQAPAADREDCRRLARGEGQRSGSVAGGGVLMEITTRSVASEPAASAASAAASPAVPMAASTAASAATPR